MDDLKERVKRMWEYLNENGIYTEEQLDKAIEELPPLDIGIFVSPVNVDEDLHKRGSVG